MYIKDEKTAYVCTDGDWMVSESDDEGDDEAAKRRTYHLVLE